MTNALCLRCGAKKEYAREICAKCQFDPCTNAETLAKSFYLSTLRYEEFEAQERYFKELENIQLLIEQGHEVPFDSTDLQRIRDELEAFEAIPANAPWIYLFRVFWPLVAAIIILYLFLKYVE